MDAVIVVKLLLGVVLIFAVDLIIPMFLLGIRLIVVVGGPTIL